MKNSSILVLSAALLVSSCTTGAGAGAYAGSSLGSVLGSAIGGIAGGPRGSDIGTIVGMAGGAIVGSAIGDAADRQERQERSEVLARRNQRIQSQKRQQASRQQYGDDTYGQSVQQDYSADDIVDPSNSSDDRIYLDTTPSAPVRNNVGGSSVQSVAPEVSASSMPVLTLRNVRFAADSGDGRLVAGKTGKVTFEIYNTGSATACNFFPTVATADGNRNIYISPSICVESLEPGQGIRYTASVKASPRLKAGEQQFFVSASRDGKPVSYVTVLKVQTARK